VTRTSYAIALGSNRRHHRHGGPERVLAAAVAALSQIGEVSQVSATVRTPAMGPAGRSFANAALLLETMFSPPDLLLRLKQVERAFGRRPGRRWGPRVLDLDIILWSEDAWSSDRLTIPHPEFRKRRFVLAPLAQVTPGWRDPLTHRSVRQLLHLVDRRRPRA
jgi:2-amino-4-hydroxy-6-hydroxymethyldihydropteridine diphosphokinase